MCLLHVMYVLYILYTMVVHNTTTTHDIPVPSKVQTLKP